MERIYEMMLEAGCEKGRMNFCEHYSKEGHKINQYEASVMACPQPLKKHMTKIYLFVTLHCYLTSLSPRQMQVTDIKLAFDLGSINYLNAMRFSRPSHNSTPLFLILPHLVSHNHINNFQAPKMPVLTLISLATTFASVSSSYPQKNLAFASLLLIVCSQFHYCLSNSFDQMVHIYT